jgi:hypothetical protein
MTRMQLIRTLAAWRPDLTDYRRVVSAYRITLNSLGRRYLELHDEIADLDTMIVAIVDELAPALVALPEKRSAIASTEAAIAPPTVLYTSSPSAGCAPIPGQRPISRSVLPKTTPSWRLFDA